MSCLAQYCAFYLLYAAGLALSRSKVTKPFPEGQGWSLAIALVGGHRLRPLPPLKSYNICGQNLWDTKATGGESYADIFSSFDNSSNSCDCLLFSRFQLLDKLDFRFFFDRDFRRCPGIFKASVFVFSASASFLCVCATCLIACDNLWASSLDSKRGSTQSHLIVLNAASFTRREVALQINMTRFIICDRVDISSQARSFHQNDLIIAPILPYAKLTTHVGNWAAAYKFGYYLVLVLVLYTSK